MVKACITSVVMWMCTSEARDNHGRAYESRPWKVGHLSFGSQPQWHTATVLGRTLLMACFKSLKAAFLSAFFVLHDILVGQGIRLTAFGRELHQGTESPQTAVKSLRSGYHI